MMMKNGAARSKSASDDLVADYVVITVKKYHGVQVTLAWCLVVLVTDVAKAT